MGPSENLLLREVGVTADELDQRAAERLVRILSRRRRRELREDRKRGHVQELSQVRTWRRVGIGEGQDHADDLVTRAHDALGGHDVGQLGRPVRHPATNIRPKPLALRRGQGAVRRDRFTEPRNDDHHRRPGLRSGQLGEALETAAVHHGRDHRQVESALGGHSGGRELRKPRAVGAHQGLR